MNMDLTQCWTGPVPIDSVVPNPGQPRTYFDQGALERTARSCGRRQIQPIVVVTHQDVKRPEVRWMIVDGERRWRGLKGTGAKTIKVSYDPALLKEEIFEASLAANFCREGHRHEEITRAVDKLVNAGKSDEEIGDLVGKSMPWANNYHRLARLHPRLLRLMDDAPEGERKLPMKVALLLISLPPSSQEGQWNKVKDLPVSEAFHKLRTSGNVRHEARRSAADDAVYVVGKARGVLDKVTTLSALPLPLMKGLSMESLKEVEAFLIKTSGKLDDALERVRDAMRKADLVGGGYRRMNAIVITPRRQPALLVMEFELVRPALLKWKCLDCRHGWHVPMRVIPRCCPVCESTVLIDINVGNEEPQMTQRARMVS